MKVKKLKISIPSSLSEIKLSQYQKFIKTTKDSEDDNFVARQMVGIFCDIPDSVVGQISAKDYDDIIKTITETLNIEPKFKTTFTLDGVEYGFIPNMSEDITVDEKADLDTFLKDVKDMHKAMAVLYRPIKIKRSNGYLIEDYEAKGNGLDVSLDIALGANVFFSTLMNDLLNYTQNFINQEVAHNPKVSQILEQNGVGITAFTNSLETTFSSLMKLVNLNYQKH